MFDTSTQHPFAPLGALGHQPGPYQQFGQPPMAGFVPIIGLVPQSSIVNLVAQSLQQAQLAGLTQQIAGSPLAGLSQAKACASLKGCGMSLVIEATDQSPARWANSPPCT